ncbi:MAG TPA: universal stress protein [Hyphomicrobiaceae bacterium]|nr:universal stress protein [Hyphomicrobiaceae bacterium]
MAGIKHILAATDLSERSERAFKRAARLRRERGATLDLLHVVEHGLVAQVRERRQALAEEYLRDWLARQPEEDRAGARFSVEGGEPFAVIIEHARERGADLIVVGEPGKQGLKEFFAGTTTERVVRHSDRPVLVVKRAGGDAYRRVLVAVDFSKGATRALDAAYAVAPGAEFLIVHAWQVPPIGFGTRDSAEKAMVKENELLRKRIERQAQDNLVELAMPASPPRVEMTAGNPFFVLRDAIVSYQPDLVAMGTHARSGLAIAMIGSLAREFLVEAPCDVLVARA